MNSTDLKDTLTLGVCDYPEHVQESQWHAHAQGQREAGISVVRLAEFSWAKIEPRAGVFDWEWLDRAIDVYAGQGLKVVLGTPTATPPAWLIARYPEVLPVDEQDQVKRFGSRRHYDHASERYRDECRRIVTAMAERYGQHPAVVGWQTDNELGHEGTGCSYGGASAQRFPNWLKSKYESLEALNLAWGNGFWSQDYTQWEQIQPPNLTAVRQPNPSHVLDFKRFCSAMIEEFQDIQIGILRSLSPGRFITHNFVIFSEESDLYRLSEKLDFVSWDSYPIGMLEYFASWESEETKTAFARTGHPDLVSMNHDLYRGLKGNKGFWVMEQQCGFANWAQYNPLPANGAVKLWTAQAWAHGADNVVYFRWRACHMAQEIMHSGLLKQNAEPDRGLPEVREMDTDTLPLGTVRARVALLHDYESLWIYNQQPHHQALNYWMQFMQYYSAVRELGMDVDIVHPSRLQAERYALVIAPALTLMRDDVEQAMRSAAKHSALLLGPRTAFRDETGKVAENGQFSSIRDLTGCSLNNFDSLRPGLFQRVDHEDGYYDVAVWAESYALEQAKAEYRYHGGPLDGQAAVTRNGNVWVSGVIDRTVLRDLMLSILRGRGERCHLLPEGVRMSRRGDKQIVYNFNSHLVGVEGEQIPAVSYLIHDTPGLE